MGARDLLHEMVCAGFTLEATADKLVIRPASRLTDELRAELRAAKPELLRLLAGAERPYRLTPAQGDAAHAEPWGDAAIGLFLARVALFLRRGIRADDADDLAERLHLRDVQADDRRLCLECTALADNRRCQVAARGRLAGADRRLEPVPTMLQRCPGFTLAPGLA